MRKINFWTVRKNIRIDPNECLFTLGNENHVFVQHKVTIIPDKLFVSINDLNGNFKSEFVGTELTESRNFMTSVLFCPNLLSLIKESPKKNLGCTWDVICLSIFILRKLFRRLDRDLEADNLLLIHAVC